ncbi:aminodeoxychorismate/anthranilate synthase component II, partial [Streptomyces sp. NPDC005877]
PRPGPALGDDPRVRAALDARRADLAPFWLRMREPVAPSGGEALVVDAEDTFTAMLAHLLRSTGLGVSVVRYDAVGLRERVLGHRGPVVLGPGPGDPSDASDPKMRVLRPLAAELLRSHRHGLLGVCLGHELIAAELGLPLVRKRVPYQGAQVRIDLFGRPERVGFYNSFTARCGEGEAVALAGRGVEVSRDAGTGEVHAVRGDGFAGVQFHPESVLTVRGVGVVGELVRGVVSGVESPAPPLP